MKKTNLQDFTICALTAITALVVASTVRGQGTIAANNVNGRGGLTSTNFGLFFEAEGSPYLATPINVTILGGPDASSLTPIVTLSGPNALVAVAPGRYADPSGSSYSIPGVSAGEPATLQVLAWMGNAATFYDANPAEDWFWPFGRTTYVNPTLFTFPNPTGGAEPSSLDGMPAMWRLLDVPEPNPVWLFMLGLPLLFFYRHRNR